MIERPCRHYRRLVAHGLHAARLLVAAGNHACNHGEFLSELPSICIDTQPLFEELT
jgi:hypothetical protein